MRGSGVARASGQPPCRRAASLVKATCWSGHCQDTAGLPGASSRARRVPLQSPAVATQNGEIGAGCSLLSLGPRLQEWARVSRVRRSTRETTVPRPLSCAAAASALSRIPTSAKQRLCAILALGREGRSRLGVRNRCLLDPSGASISSVVPPAQAQHHRKPFQVHRRVARLIGPNERRAAGATHVPVCGEALGAARPPTRRCPARRSRKGRLEERAGAVPRAPRPAPPSPSPTRERAGGFLARLLKPWRPFCCLA